MLLDLGDESTGPFLLDIAIALGPWSIEEAFSKLTKESLRLATLYGYLNSEEDISSDEAQDTDKLISKGVLSPLVSLVSIYVPQTRK